MAPYDFEVSEQKVVKMLFVRLLLDGLFKT